MSVNPVGDGDAAPDAFDTAPALASLTRDGFCVLPARLDRTVLAAARATIQAKVDVIRVAPRRYLGDVDEHSVRVMDLLPSDPDLRAICLHPVVTKLLNALFGEQPLLSNLSANVLLPGGRGMIMHTDQGYIPLPWPTYPVAANVGWALDSFTAENGGTRVVGGSHRYGTNPDPSDFSGETVVEVPAGCALVMDARLWHRAADNRSGAPRFGVFAYYVRPFIRPQVDWRAMFPGGELDDDQALARLLGLAQNPTAIAVRDDRTRSVRPALDRN